MCSSAWSADLALGVGLAGSFAGSSGPWTLQSGVPLLLSGSFAGTSRWRGTLAKVVPRAWIVRDFVIVQGYEATSVIVESYEADSNLTQTIEGAFAVVDSIESESEIVTVITASHRISDAKPR